MSRIDELVERTSPEGVEYRALGEVASYVRTRISASSLELGSYVGVNELLPDYRGRSDEARLPAEESCIAFEPGDILLGNIRPYLKKLWLADSLGGTNGDVLVIRVNDPDIVSPAFLREVLMGEGFTSYNVQNSKGAKMPRGDKKAILRFRIPIPPMEVQEEIVRVLDSFAELEVALEVALEAELEARRLQYAHYRDQLLDFREREDVSWLTLGEVCLDLRTGLNPRKNFVLNTSDASGFYITVRELSTFDIHVSEDTDRVNTDALKLIDGRSHLRVGDVLFSATGTIGRTALIASPPDTWNIKEGIYALTVDDSLVNQRFLIHLLHASMLRLQFKKASEGGTVQSISMKKLKKFRIPLPSLAEQQEIVSILDRFDALTTSLTDGLPAEIEARRQQYAYWRDRLLDFPAKPAA